MSRRLLLLPLLLLAISLVAATSASAESSSRKIVVFKAGVPVAAQQAAVRAVGGAPIKSIGLVNATVAHLTPASASALARRLDVVRVEEDALAHTTAPPSPPVVEPESKSKPGAGGQGKPAPSQTTPWGISKIQAPAAWNVTRGASVKVAVVDTGISTSHPDLKVWGGVNTNNPNKSYNDDNGHGSHVAGTIAALENSVGVVGVGPDIRLHAVKVLNANGSGYVSDIIEGLDWVVANGMQVVNMSLSTTANVATFAEAIAATYGAGIVLVAAAGNSGSAVEYPAKYPEVLAVSAIDSENSIASWSNRGTEIDLAAPGVGIPSTYKGSGYSTLSGTSMASPHVAGAAALVIATGVTDPSAVMSRLRDTALDLGATGADDLYGYGLVNAYNAVTPVAP